MQFVKIFLPIPGSVSFSVEQEEIVLLCQASGYPNVNNLCRSGVCSSYLCNNITQDLTFWWEQANETYSEPASSAQHSLRIKISNETQSKQLTSQTFLVTPVFTADFDDLTCHVSNSVGESDPCSVDVILPLTVSRIEQEELMMIIIISAAVVAVLLLASIVTCVYCVKKSAANKGEDRDLEGEKEIL